MDIKTIVVTVGLVTGISGGTVAIETRYAHRDTLDLALSKQDYVINLQIENLVARLSRLQTIRNPNIDVQRDIADTKAELERLRKLRDKR